MKIGKDYMNNKKLKIAVIDDGISQDLFEPELLGNIIINDDLSIKSYNMNSQISHGTICANIIYKYFPFLDFFSIKILSDNMTGRSDKLYRALDYCLEQKIQVVHLSIGSHYAKDFIAMQKKINEVAEKGLIIICAAHNQDIISYPAYLSNVIGVKRDIHNELSEYELKLNKSITQGIEFTSFAKHKIYFNGEERICSNSNSYAAPMITAYVCEIIYNECLSKLNVEQIKYKLIQKCVNYEGDYHFLYCYPNWISKALVLNVSGTTMDISLIPVCPWFEIVGIVTSKDIEMTLSNFLQVNFDTVIVLNNDNRKLLDYNGVYATCLKHRKNIVFIDDNLCFQLSSKLNFEIKIWHSSFSVANHQVMDNLENDFEEPIIKVILNDKWEISNLASIFLQSGYTVYCASDSPKGILYGFDYIPNIEYDRTLSHLILKTQQTYYDIFILFIIDEQSWIHLETDLTLYIEENKDQYKIEIFDGNDSFIYLHSKNDSVNDFLYQEIINRLA